MPSVSQPDLITQVRRALESVNDPELRRPITQLGMVKMVELADDSDTRVSIGIDLTSAGCPMRHELQTEITKAVQAQAPQVDVAVNFSVMTPEQRAQLREQLRGSATPVIPFSQPGNLTRVYAVASGKGGVGKSSVTANLAAALARRGLQVGIVDADIHGFSIPRMLGIERQPTRVDSMLIPPIAHNIKVVSIGMFTPRGKAVVWRGPMLHRALEQFLSDVYWGDLDVLLLDLPPGTGDIAISVAQLLPDSELLLVTTPQLAAAEVAVRAGALATQTSQRVVGVVENMSWLENPDGSRLEIFGAGGGKLVSEKLSQALGHPIPLLGQVPLDVALREGADTGTPVVLSEPDCAAARALDAVADQLSRRPRGLSGKSLALEPV